MPFLAKIERKDRPTLELLLDEYLAELSAIRDRPIGARSSIEYPYLDELFSESGRHGFFISIKTGIAGFLILRELAGGGSYQMAELFVRPEHRRDGAGTSGVLEAFARFPGSWELQVHRRNDAAIYFWEVVIASVTGGAFSKAEIDSSDGRRVQLNFEVLTGRGHS